MTIAVEICVGCVDDAVAAERAGADRIELNAGLELGGLTPSLGMLREVRAAVSFPIICMIRPRPGDFCYSDADFKVMQRDAELTIENGASGIAFGILTSDQRIDAPRCRAIIGHVGAGRATVFHRAFDLVPDPIRALDELMQLGITRILTSGGQAAAADGAAMIAKLIAHAGARIEILPVGGIRAANVHQLISSTGCTQVHASCSEWGPPGANSLDSPRLMVSVAELRALVAMVRQPFKLNKWAPLFRDV